MPRKKSANSLDSLIEEGLLVKGSDESFVIQWIPFGLPELDGVTGGGVPRKRITILTGNYSDGKSFLLQILLKKALEDGLQVAYLDTEQSYDPVWWKKVGIDTENLWVSQPPSGEKGIDITYALAMSGFDIIAVDSLAGLIPTEEIEKGADQQFIGIHARLVNRFMRKMLSGGHNAAIVCTNQLRDAMGPFEDALPGGRGQRFWAGLLMRIQREGWIYDGDDRIGFNMRVVCRKSKVGTPFKECLLFSFRGEIDVLSLLLDRAIEAGLVKQTGPWYNIMEGERLQGRNNVLEALSASSELAARLEAAMGDYDAKAS